jgi:prepilin-type N-terminal cleavage/methylation domain-containing protein
MHLHLIDPAPASRPPHQRGFTVIEMVITLAVLVVVLLGVLALFEMANRVSRIQVDVADMQQSVRTGQYDMVRTLRLAGRGGFPIQGPAPAAPGPPWPDWNLPTGFAIQVDNNVAADTFIDAPADTIEVLEGTDVLTVRGAFSAPVYTLVLESFDLELDPGSPNFGTGSLQVLNVARPGIVVPQSLQWLVRSIVDGIPEALVLVSPLDDRFYHVVELDPATSVIDDVNNPTQVTVGFKFADGTHTDAYWRLSGNDWDTAFTDPLSERSAVAYMGILEERRYYVRDVREVPGDPTSGVRPKLTQARVFPGTVIPYRNDAANWEITMADGISDLQVALGIESGGASPFEPEDLVNAADEWLFNHPDDDVDEARWRTGRLFYVRLTTTAVTERRDRDFLGPANQQVEDHAYAVPAYGALSPIAPDRTFRRRVLRTVVDLRNL